MTHSLLIAALLACPPGRSAGVGYGGYAQTYQTTYAAPAYVAPTYQYQQQVVTKYIAVEAAPVYSAVAGDYVRAQVAADRDKELREQVAKLAGSVDQLRQIVVTVGTQPAASPQVQSAPRSSPQVQSAPSYYPSPQSAPQVPSKGPVGYSPAAPPKLDPYGVGPPPLSDAAAIPILGNANLAALNRCASCHTGPESRGGVTIFASPGVLADLDADDWAAMDTAIVSGRMPKGGPAMSLVEYSAFANLMRQAVGVPRPAVAANRNPF